MTWFDGMKWFDVLAVRGDVETLHVVEHRGKVRPGMRTDVETGGTVEKLGEVFAPDEVSAHARALAMFPGAE
jgi:hypothetical protein